MTAHVKVQEREAKELQSLRAKAEKPLYKGYIISLMIVAILIHVVDEITTLVGNNVKSSMVTEFFVDGMGMTFNDGLSYLAAISSVSFVIMLIVPFYKALADRFGRKIFLVINTFGMGIAMLICMTAPTFIVYFIGTMLGSFFITHDVQVLYILETAPPDKRARYYGITKAIGTLGFVLVPLMRGVFMGDDPTKWRMVYLVPILLTVVIGILALVLARESRPFLQQRIEYLETPLEERLAQAAAAKEQKKANKNKSGVFSAIKFIFKDKDLKWVIIAMLVYYLAVTGMSGYYEPIMYEAGMQTADITNALFMYGFMFALVILLAGFVGDWLGRKWTVIIFGLLSLVLFGFFTFSANNGWNPYVVGALYGLYLGCFWQGGDYFMMLSAENSPTGLRSSVSAASIFLMMFTAIAGNFIMAAALRMTTISSAVLIVAVPAIIVAVLLVLFKVKETKGVDLTKIGSEEV